MDVTPTLDNPVSVSARELHEVLLIAHAAGNLAQRRFIDALRTLHESRLYQSLGFSSIAAYSDATFHYGRSQTLDFLRVSRALLKLPRIATAFAIGEVCYSIVSGITQVASSASEAEWLTLARKENQKAIALHVKHARATRSDHPRRGGFGLPGQPVKIAFELSPSEHAVLLATLERVAKEMSEGLAGKTPDAKTALLYLCDRVLKTDLAGRQEREKSPFAVVHHRCPSCLVAAVETEAGRVEVDQASISRMELSAEVIEIAEELPAMQPEPVAIDRPNTPQIRFEVRLRDGGRCSNPFCRRDVGAEGHCHHIQFRSEGGRTTLSNERLVCRLCHGLIHVGALVISGDPIRGLEWRVACADLTRSVRAELERFAKMPAPSGIPDTSPMPQASEAPVSEVPAAMATTVIRALEVLQWPTLKARDLAARAWERLRSAGCAPAAIDTAALVHEACRIG